MNYFESSNNNSFSMAENNTSKKKMKGNNTQKLSTDPQSVAARERRHRISNRFKTLQSLVPGGSKLDTVSMLDEAIHYVHYLKTQILIHQNMINFSLDDHCDNVNINDRHSDLFIYSQHQQQQPEFFDAGYQPSSVPTLANYCYQLGEGTSYCDGYMQQY